MPNTQYAIRLEHITKTFGEVVANHDVTLEVRRGEILSLLRILRVSWVRTSRLEARNARLMKRLGEERLLCEAKCILCRRDGISEEEAHHLLEKLAMDERVSLVDAARIVKREDVR